MKPEHSNKKQHTDGLSTRKDFLRKAGGAIAIFALPLQYCSKDGSNGPGGDDAAEPCVSFEITFNKPMDRASVEGSLGIDPSVDGFFSGEFTWSNEDTTVYYKGKVPEEGCTYTITIGGAARSKGGNYLDGNGDGTGGDSYDFEVTGV